MAFYDKIAKQWHKATGYKGGAFKEYVLNDFLLRKLTDIDNCSILELGAGNGYFFPLMLRHFSGQKPSSIVITDQSIEQIKNAKKYFPVPEARYQLLDIRGIFPFQNSSIDIILAIMVLNEIAQKGFENTVRECYRILTDNGILLISVTHPAFVENLQKKGLLDKSGGKTTMPGSGSLRLPVIIRSSEIYEKVLGEAGFNYKCEDVYPTEKVKNKKPGLRDSGKIPLALVIMCSKKK